MDWRDEYDAAIAERNRLIMALAAAERRVAEAVRIAEAWRPVSDDAPPAGEWVELLVTGKRDEWGSWWYPDRDSPIKSWRPLPPPPQVG